MARKKKVEAPETEPPQPKEETVKPEVKEELRKPSKPTVSSMPEPTLADIDAQVLNWYNSLSAGETYTFYEVAETLNLTREQVESSLQRLRNKKPDKTLGHITE